MTTRVADVSMLKDAPQPLERGARRRHVPLAFATLGVVLLATAALALHTGAYPISPGDVMTILRERLGTAPAATFDATKTEIFWAIRLPRITLGMLIGAGLAMSGTAVQGLFRNPLAEPGLIGVSSGAALCAALWILLTNHSALGTAFGAALTFHGLGLPAAAFAGGTATMAITYLISTRAGRTAPATLLLAGVAINALAAAGTALMLLVSNDALLRDITFWMMGSIAGATWPTVAIAAALIVPGVLLQGMLARPLNALLLGETEAAHLGVRVERTKRLIVLLVGLVVGTSVAFTGVVGFVGLIVPHVARLIFGPNHVLVFPASALIGGALLLAADAAARSLAPPIDLPIGMITAFLGAPFFLALLIRSRQRLTL